MPSTVIAALALLMACGPTPPRAAPSPPRTAPSPPHAVPAPPPQTTALDAYFAKVSAMNDTEVQEFMSTLLRGGNFACKRFAPAHAHCASRPPFAEPAPDATLEDPCLRRVLAIRLLHALDGEHLAALAPTLTTIAAMPDPEARLPDMVVWAVADQAPAYLLNMLLAVTRSGRAPNFEDVDKLPSGDRRAAALRAHVYATDVRAAYDPHTDRDVLLALIVDELASETLREEAIVMLDPSGPLPADLERALRRAATSRDCAMAVEAAGALRRLGAAAPAITRPRTHDIAANMRVLCLATAVERGLTAPDALAALAAYTPPGGMTVTDASVRDVYTAAQPFVPSWEDGAWRWLLEDCSEHHCAMGDEELDVTFAPAPDGGLWITDISRAEFPGACKWPSDDYY